MSRRAAQNPGRQGFAARKRSAALAGHLVSAGLLGHDVVDGHACLLPRDDHRREGVGWEVEPGLGELVEFGELLVGDGDLEGAEVRLARPRGRLWSRSLRLAAGTQAKATAATDAPSSSPIRCSVSRMSSPSGAGLRIVPGQNLVARCSQVSTFRTGRRRRAGSRGLRPGRVPWRCRIARLPGFAVAATIRPVSSARRTSGPSAVQSPLETLISLVVLVAGRPVPRPQVPHLPRGDHHHGHPAPTRASTSGSSPRPIAASAAPITAFSLPVGRHPHAVPGRGCQWSH
jgi:hypothetical protein